MRNLRRYLTLPLAATAFAALLVACGDDDNDANAETVPTDTPSASDDSDGADGATAPIEVRLVDYGFADLPETIEAGSELTIVNESESELHELVAFRLADDEERSLGELLELPQEELMPALGEPATVLLQAPGGPVIPAVGNGVLDEPGRYAIVCFIPTGADPEEYLAASEESGDGPPQGIEGGPPHFVNGMSAEITVE